MCQEDPPRERWTIEKDGEKGSGRSVLAARHDDDDDDIDLLTNIAIFHLRFLAAFTYLLVHEYTFSLTKLHSYTTIFFAQTKYIN